MDLVEGIREIANEAYLANDPERNTRTLLAVVAMADMGMGRLTASLEMDQALLSQTIVALKNEGASHD